jgi:hypothetical protein
MIIPLLMSAVVAILLLLTYSRKAQAMNLRPFFLLMAIKRQALERAGKDRI